MKTFFSPRSRSAWDTIRNFRRFSHVPRRYGPMLSLALAIVAGCGTACRCRRPAAASPASAPERVAIDGREYTLTANAWRDFLNTDPLARDLWCNGRSNTKAASVAPKALVDEIDGLITNRCK